MTNIMAFYLGVPRIYRQMLAGCFEVWSNVAINLLQMNGCVGAFMYEDSSIHAFCLYERVLRNYTSKFRNVDWYWFLSKYPRSLNLARSASGDGRVKQILHSRAYQLAYSVRLISLCPHVPYIT